MIPPRSSIENLLIVLPWLFSSLCYKRRTAQVGAASSARVPHGGYREDTCNGCPATRCNRNKKETL